MKKKKFPIKMRIPRKLKKQLKKMEKYYIFPSENEIKKMTDEFLDLIENRKINIPEKLLDEVSNEMN